jgi:hypothetical protein
MENIEPKKGDIVEYHDDERTFYAVVTADPDSLSYGNYWVCKEVNEEGKIISDLEHIRKPHPRIDDGIRRFYKNQKTLEIEIRWHSKN